MSLPLERRTNVPAIEKTAATLVVGDVLLNTGAVVEQVVPSHHGTKTYLQARYEDGYLQVVTVPADTPVATFVGEEN
jgi:hypothetical protein